MTNPYKEIFQALQKAHIAYLVVGGVAVNLYGYNRTTGDLDILMALDQENLKKMDKVMHRLGYIERLPVKLLELYDKKKVKNWLKTKGMTAYTFISEKRPQLNLDILAGYSLDFKKFYGKRTLIEIWDLKLPVISINDLIAMKKKANRDVDLLDIKALLELKAL